MKVNHSIIVSVRSPSPSLMKITKFIVPLLWISFGLLIGGFVFTDVQPRSILAIQHCQKKCFSLREVSGLAAAIGMVHSPSLIPQVVLETDKTIAMKHPIPATPIHYVIIPKKDIKDIGHVAQEDTDYLIDAYAVMQELVRQDNLEKYRIFTNGPRYQHVGYLHFHLQGRND